jgi:hypothetical protein
LTSFSPYVYNAGTNQNLGSTNSDPAKRIKLSKKAALQGLINKIATSNESSQKVSPKNNQQIPLRVVKKNVISKLIN